MSADDTRRSAAGRSGGRSVPDTRPETPRALRDADHHDRGATADSTTGAPDQEDAEGSGTRSSERAFRLSREAGMPVMIDETGWVPRGIEVVYARAVDRTITPVVARVGCEVQEAELLVDGGPVAFFERYNAALTQLYELGRQLTAAIAAERVQLSPGSLIEQAHHQLAQLGATVARRQAVYMDSSTVRIYTLKLEVEILEHLHANVAWVVRSALASTTGTASWDEATQDMDPED